MKVIAYDPYLSSDAAWRISTDIHRAKTLADAIKKADYVTIHVPKNEETTGMIGAKAFEAMKDGVTVFNFARGGIVNNAEMVKALTAVMQLVTSPILAVMRSLIAQTSWLLPTLAAPPVRPKLTVPFRVLKPS